MKAIYKGKTYPMQEYLTFKEQAELRSEIGAISWMALSSFSKRLEGARVIGYPKLEIWLCKNDQGCWLDYPHGFVEAFYRPDKRKVLA